MFDAADADDNEGALTDTTLTGLGIAIGIAYEGVEDVTITLGGGDDRMDVQGGAGRSNQLNGGGGEDLFHIHASFASAAFTDRTLAVGGGGGDDATVINLAAAGDEAGYVQSRISVEDTGGAAGSGQGDTLTLIGGDQADTLLLRQTYVATGVVNDGSVAGTPLYQKITYASTDGQGQGVCSIERLIIESGGGDDHLALDDNATETLIDAGTGQDRVQIGQMYGQVPTGVRTVAIDLNNPDAQQFENTGYLSFGASCGTTISGGDDGDLIQVYANQAALQLNGDAGDDTFVIRAFLLAGGGSSSTDTANVDGQEGSDTILYNENAPVNIDGGDGLDKVVILGTQGDDEFIIVADGVYGAGLNVSFLRVERLLVDAYLGDDTIWILGTNPFLATTVAGGGGNDVIHVGSDVIADVVSDDLLGLSEHLTAVIDTADAQRDPAYDAVLIASETVRIADARTPGVAVLPPDDLRLLEGGAGQYRVVLTHRPAENETVYVEVKADQPTMTQSDAGEATIVLGTTSDEIDDLIVTLAFTADNWSTPQAVHYAAVDDAAVEGFRQIPVRHSVRGDSDPAYDPHLQIAPLALLVVDNDTPGILVTPTNGATRVFENGPADTLEVRLTRAPAGTVTVALTCDADQVSLDRTELTFTPADWHQGQTVVVQAVDTAGRDGNRPTVIRAEVIGSAGDYEGVSADLISAEVIDDDTPGVRITPLGSTRLVEPADPVSMDDLPAIPAWQRVTYHVRLTCQPEAPVTVTLGTTHAADAAIQVSRAAVTFVPTGWATSEADGIFAWDQGAEVVVVARATDATGFGDLLALGALAELDGIRGPLEVVGGPSGDADADPALAPLVLVPGEQYANAQAPAEGGGDSSGSDTLNLWNIASGADDTGVLDTAAWPGGPDGRTPLARYHVGGLGMGAQVVLDGRTFPGGVSYEGFETLNIHLGWGDDTLDLLATDAGTVSNIFAGAGDDQVTLAESVLTRGVYDGGTGRDTIDYSRWSVGIEANLTAGRATGFNEGYDWGLACLEIVLGSQGADLITGSGDDNVLVGNAGDDRIVTGNGNNVVIDGPGSDTVFGGAGHDTYLLTPGPDARAASALDIRRFLLEIADGATIVDVPPAAEVDVPAVDRVIDAEGDNVLDFSLSAVGIVLDMSLWGGQPQRIDPDEPSSTLALDGRFTGLYGSLHDDIILGGPLGEDLRGRAGNDTLLGRGGDDYLSGDAGDDTLVGGEGNDTLDCRREAAGVWVSLAERAAIDGAGHRDTIDVFECVYGGAWDDVLVAARRPAALYGFAGDDVLTGGSQADLLVGGPGADTVRGGPGADTARWAVGDGADDLDLGGQPIDTAALVLTDQDDDVTIESAAGLSQVFLAGQPVLGIAGAAVIQLDLGAGDDVVDATAADVAVWADGGAGDDRFAGGAGNDRFDGADGEDTADYADAPAGIAMARFRARDGRGATDGVSGVEIIVGSAFDDLIGATPGGQTVFGGAGNDRLLGGAGHDALYGEDGEDVLVAGGADDILSGGLGDDTLIGSRGRNLLAWEPGNDIYRLGRLDQLSYAAAPAAGITVDRTTGEARIGLEVDRLFGSGIIIGSEGDDTLVGSRGYDVFHGGGGDDTLIGAGGNDTLVGGAGDDTLDGGGGRNTLVYHVGDGQDVQVAPPRGGAANTLQVWLSPSGVAFAFTDGAADGTFSLVEGTAAPVTLGPAGRLEVLGTDVDDDVIIGTLPRDIRSVRADLGGGDDVLNTADSATLVMAAGGAGDDRFVAGDGREILNGGDGSDAVTYEQASEGLYGSISGAMRDGGGSVDRLATIESLTGTAGADRLFGAGPESWIYGGEGNDVLVGRGGTSHLFGQGGDDTLIGGGWAARLAGGTGNDVLHGLGRSAYWADYSEADGAIDAALAAGYAGQVTDRVGGVGNAGTDTLQNVVAIRGSLFDDRIAAANRAMTIEGSGGDDMITGSTQSDLFIWRSGDGEDALVGGDGNDTVEFVDRQNADAAWTLTALTADSAQLEDGTHATSFAGVEFVRLMTADGSDRVTIDGVDGASEIRWIHVALGDGDDTLTAATSAVPIEAFGGAGADDLIGGAGHDRLFGQAGDDLIDGGGGNDELGGGEGCDVYLLGAGSGADRIVDESQTNALSFANSTSAVSIALPNIGAATPETAFAAGPGAFFGEGEGPAEDAAAPKWQTYTLGGDRVWLDGFFTDVLGSLHDDRIVGNDLDNTLAGYGGIDVLVGLAGRDALHGDRVPFTGIPLPPGIPVAGDDLIYAGDGDDTVFGDAGGDLIFGGEGNDVLVGGSLHTVRDAAGAQDDRFDGADTIEAGGGRDLLVGGAAGDTLIAHQGSNRVYGGYHGGDLSVTAPLESWFANRYSALFDGDDTIRAGGAGTMVFAGAGDDEITLAGPAIATADGGVGDDTIIGLADRVRGWYGHDTFAVPPAGRAAGFLWGCVGDDAFELSLAYGTVDVGSGADAVHVAGGEYWFYTSFGSLRLVGDNGATADLGAPAVVFVGLIVP